MEPGRLPRPTLLGEGLGGLAVPLSTGWRPLAAPLLAPGTKGWALTLAAGRLVPPTPLDRAAPPAGA